MDDKQNTKKITKEDILALLARGREIKARRQKEAEEWYAERQLEIFDSDTAMFNEMKP